MFIFFLNRIFKLSIIFLLIGGVFFFWYKLLGGFRIDKIESFLPKKNLRSPNEKIEKILNGKFRYLDKGCQAYVFVSDDQEYVLKIVRFSRYKVPFWMELVKWSKKGAEIKKRRESLKNRLLKMSLNSYELAFEKLMDLTQVEYVHLYDTDFFSNKIILTDCFQRKYKIDPNKTAFILQKKAFPLEKYLLQCKKNNDMDKTKEILERFFLTAKNLLDRKIMNKDYNCIKNTGIIDGKIIYLDVGSFVENPNLENKEKYNHFLRYSSKYFKKWSYKNFPKMLFYFEEAYEDNLKKVL